MEAPGFGNRCSTRLGFSAVDALHLAHLRLLSFIATDNNHYTKRAEEQVQLDATHFKHTKVTREKNTRNDFFGHSRCKGGGASSTQRNLSEIAMEKRRK